MPSQEANDKDGAGTIVTHGYRFCLIHWRFLVPAPSRQPCPLHLPRRMKLEEPEFFKLQSWRKKGPKEEDAHSSAVHPVLTDRRRAHTQQEASVVPLRRRGGGVLAFPLQKQSLYSDTAKSVR